MFTVQLISCRRRKEWYPEVAIIDEYGNLIARKAGKATLTTTINGKKIKITVNVKEKQ